MSTATATADRRFIETAIPLLKEYAEKLREIVRQARELSSRTKAEALFPTTATMETIRESVTELTHRWKYLKPPAEELARQASAILEEGRINGLERVQLWLRLSEFEHYLLMAREAVDKLNALK